MIINKVSHKEIIFKKLFITCIILTVLRIFTYDIWELVNDTLTTIMIYIYFTSDNICLAILIFINAIISLIYGVIMLLHILTIIKEELSSMLLLFFIIYVYAIIVYSSISFNIYHIALIKKVEYKDELNYSTFDLNN
jgi:hypothetical protein